MTPIAAVAEHDVILYIAYFAFITLAVRSCLLYASHVSKKCNPRLSYLISDRSYQLQPTTLVSTLGNLLNTTTA